MSNYPGVCEIENARFKNVRPVLSLKLSACNLFPIKERYFLNASFLGNRDLGFSCGFSKVIVCLC